MTANEIARTRLAVHQLANKQPHTSHSLVAHMGVVQAQDYAMAKWAIALRLQAAAETQVEDTFSRGNILRTHILRPTWHFVAPDDIRWMLALTAPRIKSQIRSRRKELDITPQLLAHSQDSMAQAIEQRGHLSRDELDTVLAEAGIKVDKSQLYHLLLGAELDALICSGAPRGKVQTYALMTERVKGQQDMTQEAALTALAQRYFASHGPATVSDFAWWSGLGVRLARQAHETIRQQLLSFEAEGLTFWTAPMQRTPAAPGSVILLPAYDEFLLGYKESRGITVDKAYQKAISFNGVFRPVVLLDGRVVGIWKRKLSKTKVSIDCQYFESIGSANEKKAELAAEAFGQFAGLSVEFKQSRSDKI
ncbi:MAG: winged helix DNA-binding domain-containing protein [Bacteroidota bacterium]